jgi:hypothetical protein
MSIVEPRYKFDVRVIRHDGDSLGDNSRARVLAHVFYSNSWTSKPRRSGAVRS